MFPIRALQHYLYCPHRWAMLYLEENWKENLFTVRAEIAHERVHSDKIIKKAGGKIVFSSVVVYSERKQIYGKTDSLELIPDENGVQVEGYPDKYKIVLVEYKPTEPKGGPREAEKLQLYAQTVCARELFSSEVKSYFYYADTKRRVEVTFDETDENKLNSVLSEMERWESSFQIPLPEFGEKCSGCSLWDSCMPKNKAESFQKIVKRELNG